MVKLCPRGVSQRTESYLSGAGLCGIVKVVWVTSFLSELDDGGVREVCPEGRESTNSFLDCAGYW